MRKTYRYILSLIALSLVLASCSDWTDTESLNIKPNKIDETNPEVYQRYLASLREYKKSEHKVTYSWFDNSEKAPSSRAEHMISLPDSIDYIVLLHPDNLSDWEVKEMNDVRQKGTKVIMQYDFDAVKSEYDAIIADMEHAGEDISEMPPFISVLTESVDKAFKVLGRYKYDGLIMGYKGKSMLHMTEQEKAEFSMYQNTFITIASRWKENNESKTLAFMGSPQNIIDKTILESYEHIIIPTQSAIHKQGMIFEVLQANVEGVPADRFVVVVETKSLDPSDTKTGMWLDGKEPLIAVTGLADWANFSHNDFLVAGIGVYDISRDYYYSAGTTYSVTRNAIQTLNPSLKK